MGLYRNERLHTHLCRHAYTLCVCMHDSLYVCVYARARAQYLSMHASIYKDRLHTSPIDCHSFSVS